MPPRSRGCRVCVQRRVKCDGTRPVCIRCQKAGRECDGPPEPLPTFMDETQAVTMRYSRGSSSKSESPTSTTARPSFSTTVYAHPSFFPAPRMPQSVSEDPEVYYCNFFMTNFFNVGASYSELEEQKMWIGQCFQHPSAMPTSNLTVRCLFQCYFARTNFWPDLENEGKALYSRVLLQLRTDLADPERSRQFDTVSSVALLITLESMLFTSHGGWMQHVLGMRALLEMLGPRYFQAYPARAAFMLVRRTCILAAMAARERTILEKTEWHPTVFEKNHLTEQFYLLGCLSSRLPGLLADTDEVLQEVDYDAPAHGQRVMRIYAAWLSVLAELRSWHGTWATHLEDYVPRTEQVDKSTEEGLSLPFDELITYKDAVIGGVFCSYYAHIMTAYSAIDLLCSRHPTSTFSSANSPPNQRLWHKEIAEKALKICQALPYTLSIPGAHMGKFTILFPIRIAFHTLQATSAQARWLVEVCRKLADVGGINLAVHTTTTSGFFAEGQKGECTQSTASTWQMFNAIPLER